jgi:hypothetical protein
MAKTRPRGKQTAVSAVSAAASPTKNSAQAAACSVPEADPQAGLRAQQSRLFLLVSLLTALCSCVAALYVLGWPTFTMPLEQWADSLFTAATVKTIGEFGWYGHNPRLGAPGAMELLDFPISDNGHFLILKVLGLFGGSFQQVLNTYLCLTFGLCGGMAAWVLQRCGVTSLAAAVGGLCYALLPYHFLRGCAHLQLAGYFCVPLCVYIILSTTETLPQRHRLSHRACWVGALCVPAFGGYYTFFFCYLLAIAVALHSSCGCSWRTALRQGSTVLGAAIVGLLLNLLPSFLHRFNSDDSLTIIRPAVDTEVYALKLVQMFVPATAHRNATLQHLADVYNKAAPMVTENRFASMGLVLSVLFLVVTVASCVCLWWPETQAFSPSSQLRKTFILNLSCFIFGTLGGLSALLGFYVSPFIRAANRIVVFMDFLTLLAGGWLLTWAFAALRPGLRRPLGVALAALCAGVIVWENHDTDYFPQQQAAAEQFTADAKFFANLEKSLPQDQDSVPQVFQLPYVRFPEGGLGPHDYFHMRPYLHTQAMRFSFGAMGGSRADLHNMQAASLLRSDPAAFKKALRAQGFTGVLYSRAIPTRDRVPLDPLLGQVLGPPAMQSPNFEWAYYPVR